MVFKYLDLELMEKVCHKLAVALFDQKEDPIAEFKDKELHLLESALAAPRTSFGGEYKYKTLEEQAVVIWYHLNRNHAFRNGNKRISTASFLVFLYINDHWVDSGVTEMVNKSLYIANTDAKDREGIIQELVGWTKEHIIQS